MSNWIREAKYVEDKFLEQLKVLGWNTLVINDNDNKHRTDIALLRRSSFKEVILNVTSGVKIGSIEAA